MIDSVKPIDFGEENVPQEPAGNGDKDTEADEDRFVMLLD